MKLLKRLGGLRQVSNLKEFQFSYKLALKGNFVDKQIDIGHNTVWVPLIKLKYSPFIEDITKQ